MHAQSRKTLFLLRISTIFPLLSSWGVRSSSFFRSARSPNSRGRLSLNLTTGPATKHQKGKPGKGSPRLEKNFKKKEEWKGGVKMVVVVGSGWLSGNVRRLFVVLEAGERSLSTTARCDRYPSSSLPRSLCWNQFRLCFFVIWG